MLICKSGIISNQENNLLKDFDEISGFLAEDDLEKIGLEHLLLPVIILLAGLLVSLIIFICEKYKIL